MNIYIYIHTYIYKYISRFIHINIYIYIFIYPKPLEAALLRHSGRFSGLVLDVFEREPLPEASPLWQLPNALLSSHNADLVERSSVFFDDEFGFKSGRMIVEWDCSCEFNGI